MLAAAALVFWGGERLSRHQVEEREPADRVRLLDFSATLGHELDRLDALYESHLAELVGLALARAKDQLPSRCEALVGIRTLTVFAAGGKQTAEYSGMRPAPGLGRRVPGLEWEEGGRASQALNVISLPKAAENQAMRPGSGWVSGADGMHRLYWIRAATGTTVAIVIDDAELQACLATHLRGWVAGPFAPLTETGQLAAIYGPRRSHLFPAPADTGPAALVIPHRTALGEWQVEAWDRLTVR
ncbi:MAG: sensor histidine kinase, partial [Akkermansiaceae bacterium]|nr:sensor histidine kinase [Akkermansiaceae bacterium]